MLSTTRGVFSCWTIIAVLVATVSAAPLADSVENVVLDLDQCYSKDIDGVPTPMCLVVEEGLVERGTCKLYCPSWENTCTAAGPELQANDPGASSALEQAFCRDQCDTRGAGCARKRGEEVSHVELARRANCSRSACFNTCRVLGQTGKPGVMKVRSLALAVASGIFNGACTASCAACDRA